MSDGGLDLPVGDGVAYARPPSDAKAGVRAARPRVHERVRIVRTSHALSATWCAKFTRDENLLFGERPSGF